MGRGFRLRDALAAAEEARASTATPAAEPPPAAELAPAAESTTAVPPPAAVLYSGRPLNEGAAGASSAAEHETAAPTPAAELPTAVRKPAVGLRPAAEPSPAAPIVEEKEGYLRIPNTIVFSVFPQLKPVQRIVFEELFLFTHGFGKNPNIVSQKKIVRRCGISEKYAIQVVGELVEKGYVRKLDAIHGGAQSGRGLLLEVWPFNMPDRKAAGHSSAAGRNSAVGRGSAAGRSSDMKEHERKHEKAPDANASAPSIYEIRTIGARLFERHRSDGGFDHKRLADLVADALAAQGITPNGELIEEAIKGMAV